MAVRVSVVVPLHNEEENVHVLAEKIQAVFAQMPEVTYECLFVNDGSTDGTREAVEKAAKANPQIRPIHLERRSGQSAALWAGMRRAEGDYVLTLDGDLQNDPADFPKFLEGLRQYDCVFGYRARRQDTWTKRISSRIANRARRWWLQDDIRDTGCGLKGFRRHCIARLVPFNGMHRYFGVFMKAAGMRIAQIEVAHHPRRFGASKYGIWDRLWRGIYDLVGVAWLRRRYLDIRREGDE